MISLDEFEQQWLETVRSGSPSTVELGHRFAEKILRDWHEIDAATAEVILCDGSGDGGIDAAIFVKSDPAEDIEGDTWTLVQSKYGSAYSGADTITSEAQKVFATLEGKRDSLSSLSTELVARLRNFLVNVGPKDRLEYVLATNRNLSSSEQEYLDNIRILGRAKFGECFDVDSVSIETIFKKACEDESSEDPGINIELTTTVASSGEILFTGATRLRDIFHFMQAYKAKTGDLDFLYEKNVRKFLGNKRKVNKGIEHTIENHPERFGLYNNGITIVAEGVTRDAANSNKLSLKNPFIVNGCQTTRSIWSVLQRRLNSGGSAPSEKQIAWEARLDKAVAVTKIVVVGSDGEELLTETTRYTNSQNAVADKDFIALEKDFRNWGPVFNSRYNVFLEIQRGAWEARRAFQKQNPQALPQFSECANAFELLKAYAAGWLSEPGTAYGKNPPFSPGGTFFKRIVNESDFGVESLYAAYLVQILASSYSFGRGATSSTRGQTRYLFIMIVVDLVKDVLINSGLAYGHADISKAIIALKSGEMLHELGEAAVGVVDEYLTDGNEDCLFTEPEFLKNKDLNSFLKSEKLGKGEEFSPKLKTLISMSKKIFRKSAHSPAIKKILGDLQSG
jgi:hypothetical protein